MGIKCGIVGLPNVGKSTLFNALTKAGIAAANFPFCTIEPNVGVVPVPDPRLERAGGDRQAAEGHSRPRSSSSTSPASSPARRAAKGWATSSSRTSARSTRSRTWCAASSIRDVIHVSNKVDPIADIETIDTELALADLESVEKALQRAERSAKTGDKDAKARVEVLGRIRAGLDAGKPARALGLSDDDKAQVRDLFLLTLKPVMYVANVLEDGFENNPHLDAVRARAVGEGAEVVPVSAAIEEELSQLDDADRDAFLHDLGLDEPGLNRVIRAAYKLLGLQTYFTAGVKEVRAWTVQGRFDRPAGRGGDPHRLREGLHPRRNHRATTTSSSTRAKPAPAMPAACAWKARNTGSRKATSCISASTSDRPRATSRDR